MAYDPNEPRDESGKWTSFEGSTAIQQAASDGAKNIKEAEDWAANNLKTKIISYKSVDINVANQINKSLYDIEQSYKDFPQTTIGFDVSGKAYAQYEWDKNVVNLRKRYENIELRRADDNLRWRKQYGDDYHVSTSLDGLIKHEVAHSWDNNTGRKLYKELENLDIGVKNKLYGISGYAFEGRYSIGSKTQGSEMIAEVISAKQTKSTKYTQLPKEAKDIIDKYFK